MGFLSRIAGAALDAVDNTITDARARHGAQADAARQGRTVRPGQTVYTVVEHQRPEGGTVRLVHEHVADGRSGVTGQAMFGHQSAASLHLNNEVYTERPAGLQTLREYSKGTPGPDIHGHVSDY